MSGMPAAEGASVARIHLFGDEFGNFDFTHTPGASRYFIITTVAFFNDRQACADLQQLRFDLAWEGVQHPGPFRASEEQQPIRDRVYGVLASHRFRVDTTILEKRKANPKIRVSDERFYHIAWYYHMKYVAPRIANSTNELLVVAASIGTKKKQDAFQSGIRDVMRQVTQAALTRTANWPANADTCLQIADYCCWAIQRKWESGDPRSYELIRGNIHSEHDLFSRNGVYYY